MDILTGRTRAGASSLPEASSLARGDEILVCKSDGEWYRVPLAKLIEALDSKLSAKFAPEPEEPEPVEPDPPPSGVPKTQAKKTKK